MKSEKTELEHKLQQNAKHLSRLKHEKEVIVRQVEQEEEFLTNTLQQKLSKVLAEKVEIENDLEQEQEYISNRLQKQVAETLKEKRDMERRLEEEQAKVHAMEEEKRKLAQQLQTLQVSVEVEEERISNQLGELSLTPKIFQRRRSKWETQSLPTFSPRLSPYPSPPATPYSSRSRSPAMRSSRDSSRSTSPSVRSARSSFSSMSGTSSIVSIADTMGSAFSRHKPAFAGPTAPVHRGAGVLPPPPSSPVAFASQLGKGAVGRSASLDKDPGRTASGH